jgi:coenzyme F420-0:L-glutamate ligase/coenzyme F420-1:gamma-L-glutamate ligase
LLLTPLTGLPLVEKGDDLAALIQAALTRAGLDLRSRDILVLAQKIVSKAEGRLVRLRDVSPSPRALDLAAQTEKDPRLVELILSESRAVVRARPGLIVVEHRHGFICANAGIDHSNVALDDDAYLLLPADADASARALQAAFAVPDLGILIIDSHGRAWRNGTVGLTIGLAGLPGLVDLRGEPDLFGYELQVSEVAAADELAAAASLVMGQADEGIPVVHVRGFPYPPRAASLAELIRPAERDLFR